MRVLHGDNLPPAHWPQPLGLCPERGEAGIVGCSKRGIGLCCSGWYMLAGMPATWGAGHSKQEHFMRNGHLMQHWSDLSCQLAGCRLHACAETVQQQLWWDSFAGASPSLTDCCITNQFQSSYQRTPRANPACNMSLPMISLEDSTERSGVQAVAQSLCSKYGKMLLPHHAAARGWTGVLA